MHTCIVYGLEFQLITSSVHVCVFVFHVYVKSDNDCKERGASTQSRNRHGRRDVLVQLERARSASPCVVADFGRSVVGDEICHRALVVRHVPIVHSVINGVCVIYRARAKGGRGEHADDGTRGHCMAAAEYEHDARGRQAPSCK